MNVNIPPGPRRPRSRSTPGQNTPASSSRPPRRGGWCRCSPGSPPALDRHLLLWSVTKGLLDLTENIPEILAGTLKTVDGTPITVQPDQDGLYEVQALPPTPSGTADPLAVLDQDPAIRKQP